ncbi:hypothetical protein BFF78_27195 [Streptomyces fodineus]|uniref:Uncharacterized protein n=1 Tax=Streptomyces fodineus TaxID=1904616 RepID=A0A1D7YFG4_9ACTN|nr:hypothetical protein BFF78_27195 [Streptomyces fodineus]
MVRWLVTGILTLVALSLVGGLLVGLLAGQSFQANGSLAQCAKAIRVFDLLLVSPLAIGIGAALVVGVPSARVLRARRSHPDGRPTTRRDVMLVTIAAKCGFVTAALFWSVSGLVVPGTSITAAHWVNGDDTGRLHKDFYGFKLPSVENWSIIESIGLALLLVAVAIVTAWRFVPGADRSANRQVLVTTAVLTLVLGGFFAWHAAQSYDDVKNTPINAAQGPHHHTMSAQSLEGRWPLR